MASQMEHVAASVTEVPTAPVHERIFGECEFMTLELDSLIDLSQMRAKPNSQYSRLKESIDQEDLDNRPNIARVTDGELTDYIEFTNRTWGSDAKLEDFLHLRQADGRFNLIVAGHNRVKAMKELAADYAAENEVLPAWQTWAKIMKSNTVEAIVTKQFSENLHASVSQERAAMAMVELYEFGILKGKWSDVNDFVQAQAGKVNRSMVNDACVFANLTPKVRNLVFGGYIPYAAGVELGKASPVIREWMMSEAGLPEDAIDGDVEAAVEFRLMREAAHIGNGRLNSTAAKKYIGSITDTLSLDLAEKKGSPEAASARLEQEALFGLKSAGTIAREMRDAEERRFVRQLRELQEGPLAMAAGIMTSLTDARSSDLVHEVITDSAEATRKLTEHARKRAARPSGRTALTLVPTEY